MKTWTIEFEVETTSGDCTMSRRFETESENMAREEGRRMERDLNSGDFACFRLSKIRNRHNVVVWQATEDQQQGLVVIQQED